MPHEWQASRAASYRSLVMADPSNWKQATDRRSQVPGPRHSVAAMPAVRADEQATAVNGGSATAIRIAEAVGTPSCLDAVHGSAACTPLRPSLSSVESSLQCPKCGAWNRPGASLIELQNGLAICGVCAHAFVPAVS